MKSIERFALLGSLLALAAMVARAALNAVMQIELAANQRSAAMEWATWMIGSQVMLALMLLSINALIASALLRAAHGRSERPWLWCVFGFFSGLIAAILFCFLHVASMARREPAETSV